MAYFRVVLPGRSLPGNAEEGNRKYDSAQRFGQDNSETHAIFLKDELDSGSDDS